MPQDFLQLLIATHKSVKHDTGAELGVLDSHITIRNLSWVRHVRNAGGHPAQLTAIYLGKIY